MRITVKKHASAYQIACALGHLKADRAPMNADVIASALRADELHFLEKLLGKIATEALRRAPAMVTKDDRVKLARLGASINHELEARY